MVQRYKFESKSQQFWSGAKENASCFQWFKGTNLKANHNGDGIAETVCRLFPMVQRYKFESKSQQNTRKKFVCMVVSNGSKVQI